jgi:hypothetical protein
MGLCLCPKENTPLGSIDELVPVSKYKKNRTMDTSKKSIIVSIQYRHELLNLRPIYQPLNGYTSL